MCLLTAPSAALQESNILTTISPCVVAAATATPYLLTASAAAWTFLGVKNSEPRAPPQHRALLRRQHAASHRVHRGGADASGLKQAGARERITTASGRSVEVGSET